MYTRNDLLRPMFDYIRNMGNGVNAFIIHEAGGSSKYLFVL